jgi:hypothetical protein
LDRTALRELVMKLHEDELLTLKEDRRAKCWRSSEPSAAEVGNAYRSGGEDYTVVACEENTGGDVLRRFGKAEYERLREEFGPRWQKLWLVVVVIGDRTDKPRFLAPSGGKGGDYTHLPAQTIDEDSDGWKVEAVDDETLNGFAKAVAGDNEKRRERRKKKQRLRSARNLLKKALDDA